jgi:hypothetical protein
MKLVSFAMDPKTSHMVLGVSMRSLPCEHYNRWIPKKSMDDYRHNEGWGNSNKIYLLMEKIVMNGKT